MNHFYMLLERVAVQDANCVAGLTYGFPAISHFLGFSHALQLKLVNQFDVSIDGCAVFCHEHHSHTFQANDLGDFMFIQRKSSPTFKKHAKASPPIIEEGKMHLTVSLLLKCSGDKFYREDDIKALTQVIDSKANQLRLAGGVITQITSTSFFRNAENREEKHAQLHTMKRKLMPSFVLCDKHDVLQTHYEQLKEQDTSTDLLEAWLDFARLTYQAETDTTENNHTEWKLKPKPAKGWLVPIMTGYTAIAPLQAKGTITGSRSPEYPFSFVEAVYSIGEWLSTHRINDLDRLMWHYHHTDNWYLCQQPPQKTDSNEPSLVSMDDSLADDFDFDK